jgi:hypothetical protein
VSRKVELKISQNTGMGEKSQKIWKKSWETWNVDGKKSSFFFLVVVGFELWVLHLLDRCPTTWPRSQP